MNNGGNINDAEGKKTIAVIVNSNFMYNKGNGHGGVIYANGSMTSLYILKNNRFHDNMANGNGGVILLHHNPFFICEMSFFYNNQAKGKGGAINIAIDKIISYNYFIDKCHFINNNARYGGN